MVKWKVVKDGECISLCPTYRLASEAYFENNADAIYEFDEDDEASSKCVTMRLKEAS